MVGASSIGFYAEPANPRRVNETKSESAGKVASADGELAALAGEDDVQLSGEARGVAVAAQALAKEEELTELQARRLEEIRNSLEKGTYKVQEVVLKVAARVAKYVQ